MTYLSLSSAWFLLLVFLAFTGIGKVKGHLLAVFFWFAIISFILGVPSTLVYSLLQKGICQ